MTWLQVTANICLDFDIVSENIKILSKLCDLKCWIWTLCSLIFFRVFFISKYIISMVIVRRVFVPVRWRFWEKLPWLDKRTLHLRFALCQQFINYCLCFHTASQSLSGCSSLLLAALQSHVIVLKQINSVAVELFFPSIPRHYELFAVQSTLIFHSPGKAVDE